MTATPAGSMFGTTNRQWNGLPREAQRQFHHGSPRGLLTSTSIPFLGGRPIAEADPSIPPASGSLMVQFAAKLFFQQLHPLLRGQGISAPKACILR
jgi:hypothetical protein